MYDKEMDSFNIDIIDAEKVARQSGAVPTLIFGKGEKPNYNIAVLKDLEGSRGLVVCEATGDTQWGQSYDEYDPNELLKNKVFFMMFYPESGLKSLEVIVRNLTAMLEDWKAEELNAHRDEWR